MAALLTSLLGGLTGWLAIWFGKKVAMGAAVVSVFLFLTALLATSLYAITVALYVAVPGDWSCYIGMWIPDNAAATISAVISAHLLRWSYDVQMGNVKALASIA